MSFLARYASVRTAKPAGPSMATAPKNAGRVQPVSGCAPRQVTCTMYASGIIRACQADSLCAIIAMQQNNHLQEKNESQCALRQARCRPMSGRGIGLVVALCLGRLGT